MSTTTKELVNELKQIAQDLLTGIAVYEKSEEAGKRNKANERRLRACTLRAAKVGKQFRAASVND